MRVVNDLTGKSIEVKDIPPDLLGTALVVLDQRLQRWVAPNFLKPYKDRDLKKKKLMNERRKAWLFMDKIYDKSDCRVRYYLERLAEAYHLPRYNKLYRNIAIAAEMEDKELDEYSKL